MAILVESKIFIGLISDIEHEEGEAEVSLLDPPLPATHFQWSENLLSYVTPLSHIIVMVDLIETNDNKYLLPTNKILVIRQLGGHLKKKNYKRSNVNYKIPNLLYVT